MYFSMNIGITLSNLNIKQKHNAPNIKSTFYLLLAVTIMHKIIICTFYN